MELLAVQTEREAVTIQLIGKVSCISSVIGCPMCKVLVVEDDRRQRWFYYEELKNEGHQVLAVSQGEQALEVLDQVPVDVVVMDLLLPDGKGLDYLQKMLARNPALKIIINSAYPIYKQDFRSWNADRFVTKSSDLYELKNAINEVADGYQHAPVG